MEIWKDYKKIQVSNLGRVKTRIKGIHLGYPHKTGYYMVKADSVKNERVSVIVAECFLTKPKSNKRLVVDHINGNKRDNRVENLRYLTHQDNTIEAIKLGLKTYKKGSESSWSGEGNPQFGKTKEKHPRYLDVLEIESKKRTISNLHKLLKPRGLSVEDFEKFDTNERNSRGIKLYYFKLKSEQ